ncbi:MAG: ribokinase [Candidatus Baldrarchaeia archaeon]
MSREAISVVGSIHMDFIIFADRFPKPGETITGKGFEMQPGGKGANQAVAAARLGKEVYMIGRVGDDYVGDQLIRNLKENKVNTFHVFKTPRVHSGVALITVDSKGENTIVVAPGADNYLLPKDIDDAEESLKKSKILLIQYEIPPKTIQYAVKKAKNLGLTVIVNPAFVRKLPNEFYKYVDILTPNRLEALEITCEKTVLEAGRKLLKMGVGTVVITLGAEGALVFHGKGHFKIPAVKVKPVDTTGAGDAFNGALAVAILEEKSIEEAVKFASAAAALKVTKPGAQRGLPSREELKSFLENIKL